LNKIPIISADSSAEKCSMSNVATASAVLECWHYAYHYAYHSFWLFADAFFLEFV